MVDPASLFILAVNILAKSAPYWLHALETVAQSQGKEFVKSQGKQYLDKRKYLKHMRSALENAAMKGIVRFDSFVERDRYRAIIEFLAQPGPNKEALLSEALNLLTLSDTPDFGMLSEKYNLSERIKSLAEHTEYEDMDATPYLNSFFDQFKDELFADDLFKQQISNVLMVRSNLSIQQSLTKIAATLPAIKDAVTNSYTDEQFAQDIQNYLAHLERSFRYLKMVGIVPKDQSKDPELEGIFVPLRVIIQNPTITTEKQENDSLVAILEQFPYLVLLGGPGSGKSTATKYFAWTHAAARLPGISSTPSSLLPGNPVPLRIELRRFSEERRKNNSSETLLSYAATQLRREGAEISSQMFKRLLANKNMFLLFDGLDEVATLDERKQLVEEIEGFVGNHPGNRIIVTSRPVGYELARLSNQLFTHAQVQNFNDDQIRRFLESWYTYVLRLSPIPHDDRQELEELFKTLKENPRLHKLAENPLLLTVITPLHRYERLPDKRVQVYDRCAEILIETWAKLRGTKERWRDIQISREDQYACVAYLGSVLHERSQEDDDSSKVRTTAIYYIDSTADTATDVPSKFILKQIKRFLNDRNLISDIKAQGIEAERFLELMQVEAGLIVERGTNEYNENLYGFVHRTFQEYFAAADVYERYQQEVELSVISDFLIEHLHDPHWHEVILLLLGKLKRKPLTILLRSILEGKIKSHRSQYLDILQQDLFFVCDCLAEEMSIENELMESMICKLNYLIKDSLFESQRITAAEYLGKLMQTRQYTNPAQAALTALIVDPKLEVDIKIATVAAIYKESPMGSRTWRQTFNALLELAQRSELSIDQRIAAAGSLIYGDVPKAENRQAAQILLELAQRSELPIDQRIAAAWSLNYRDVPKAENRQAAQILLELAQRSELPVDQRIAAARSLSYRYRDVLKAENRQAVQILLELAQRSELPVDQRIAAAVSLSYRDVPKAENRQAVQILLELAQRSELPIDQRIAAAVSLTYGDVPKTVHQQATQILLDIMQNRDLPVNQRLLATARYIHASGDHIMNVIDSIRVQAILVALELLPNDAVPDYFNKHWEKSRGYFSAINVKDLPHLIQLVQHNSLPMNTRNNIYEVLAQVISQFDKLQTKY